MYMYPNGFHMICSMFNEEKREKNLFQEKKGQTSISI